MTSRVFVRALKASIAVALLAGCHAGPAGRSDVGRPLQLGPRVTGAPASVINPARRASMRRLGGPLPDWMILAPQAASKFAYVSQFNLTYVNEYAKNNKKNAPPLCQIFGQPYVNGIGVDASRNLWVPQGGQFKGITTEFAPNCGAALVSISDTHGQPAAVAFDSKSNVYVLDIMGSNGPPGNIVVYPRGKKTIKTILSDSNSFLWFDVAIDAANNVFMVYSDPFNKGHIDEFVGGKNPAIALPISIGFPGGLEFDSVGNLLVVDQDAVNVSVYAPPYSGLPIATIPLKADSVPCRFGHFKRQLYCSDFTNGSIDVYNYNVRDPSKTSYSYSFTNGIMAGSQNAGIALSPAAPN